VPVAFVATMTCTPGTHGSTPTSCNVTTTYGGNAVPGSSVTSVAWDWGDGTTADNSSSVPVKPHTYVNAGTYTVLATVTATINGTSMTAPVTSKSVVVP
jgi:PKD repeat protein